MKNDYEILQIAKQASNNAYSPYSNFQVGAYAVFESGRGYSGCNVENSSYGLSLCAERNALSSAIADGEKSRLIKIAIFSPKSHLCFPCGACRQWIFELGKGYNTEVILEDENEKTKTFYINDIFQFPFNIIK